MASVFELDLESISISDSSDVDDVAEEAAGDEDEVLLWSREEDVFSPSALAGGVMDAVVLFLLLLSPGLSRTGGGDMATIVPAESSAAMVCQYVFDSVPPGLIISLSGFVSLVYNRFHPSKPLSRKRGRGWEVDKKGRELGDNSEENRVRGKEDRGEEGEERKEER